MTRLVDASRAIRETLPEFAVPVVALITFLGSSWFVGSLLAVVYRRYDREGAVAAAGVLLGSTGSYLSLKHVFALPRPDARPVSAETLSGPAGPLYETVVITDGYGFPSGHAVTATVAYLLLAEIVPVGTRRRRYAAAVGIAAVVSLSRVALGAHYLADVAVGAAFGVAFLLVARRLLARRSDRRPSTALGLGTALAAASVPISGGALDALLLVSVTVPLWLWWLLAARPRRDGTTAPLARRPLLTRAVLLAAAALPVAVAVAYLGLV